MKHVPLRTCLGCRRVRPKSELLRLVSHSGKLELDLEYSKPGRGAYMCRLKGCWQGALKGNRMDVALRTEIKQKDKEELLEYIKNNLPDV